MHTGSRGTHEVKSRAESVLRVPSEPRTCARSALEMCLLAEHTPSFPFHSAGTPADHVSSLLVTNVRTCMSIEHTSGADGAPVLLSASPWMSSSGFLILSAWLNGLIRAYVSGACHSVRSSAWKPKGVSVLHPQQNRLSKTHCHTHRCWCAELAAAPRAESGTPEYSGNSAACLTYVRTRPGLPTTICRLALTLLHADRQSRHSSCQVPH